MTDPSMLQVRGYLIHMSHYDPIWVRNKPNEKPFDLKVGLEIVDALAETGFNMLIIDLDDGVLFNSHPELKRHYTVPMDHLRTLVAHARSKGLEVVPKLNFAKGDQCHNDWFSPHHELDDDHKDYWRMAFEVIDEVIEVCKPERYFHIGMDEDFQRSDAQYVKAVKKLRSELAQRKLKTVMWNDTIHLSAGFFQCVSKTIAAENSIEPDVAQILWDYGEVKRHGVERMREIRDKGFEVWIAPGRSQEIVKTWRQVAADERFQGMLMTTWQSAWAGTRDYLLQMIREVGPLYSAKTTPGKVPVKLVELQEVSVAPKYVAKAKRPDPEILAPNFLKQARPKLTYLVPNECYMRNWMVLGPFPFNKADYKQPQQQDSIETSFVDHEPTLVAKPEGTVEAGVTWRKWTPAAGESYPQVVNMAKMYKGQEYATAYLIAHIHSAQDVQDHRLYLGMDDYVKVWMNGDLVHTFNRECRAVVQDHDLIKGVALNKGWNTMVVKCVNIKATWGFMARIADGQDRSIEVSVS